MQSHTLIESQATVNDPLSSSVNGGAPTRMGPVPGEFLRPLLPVLSSSNKNATLKYHKKAAILNHNQNLKQELETKYRSNGSENTNGYNGSKDLATSGDNENENKQNVNDKLGSSAHPKHFASMQGPYGIINNNLFLKKEEEERQGRSRFLSSDLLNNNTSDKMNSSQVKYSGQFQANYIGHLTSQNYVNRPNQVNSESAAQYLNGHNDRRDNLQSHVSRSSPQNLNRSSPLKLESNQENTSQNDQSDNTNKKFKVPTSKVPKESLLKYRILHKNNQRNLTQVDATSSSQETELMTPAVAAPASHGTLSSNGNLCDSNVSNPSNFNGFEPASNLFKRPADSNSPKPQVEATSGVINSEIPLNHFSKGVLIKLENGLIKHLEELRTEDFVTSAEKSTKHRLEPSTVMKMEEKTGATHIVLTLCYGERRYQVEYESLIEQPYYVIDKGWSSYSPSRTHHKYGLACQQLNVGDTCISLCQKDAPSPSKPTQAKLKRKELEKHFNLLTSKDREMNERKRRRWSAPDQIVEKTKKSSGKSKEEDEDATPVTTSASFNHLHVADKVPSSSYQSESFPTSYFNQYPTSTSFGFSTIQSSLPAHLQYVSPISNLTSSTHLTAAMTKPIVSHLPTSSHLPLPNSRLPNPSPSTNFSISTLSTPASSHDFPTEPSYLIHSSVPSSTIAYSYASTPNYINTPISTVYARNAYPVKYSSTQPMEVPQSTQGRNNFGNVGTLAKSASQGGYSTPSKAMGTGAVDFSKYSKK